MVVGPEFGPLAGVCVALVEGRPAPRGDAPWPRWPIGFPLAIAAPRGSAREIYRATGLTPERLQRGRPRRWRTSSPTPTAFSVIVAFCAGVAGMLSLTTAKSSVLIGVLISVTTIPAAANVGVSLAYEDWSAMRGSLGQLGLNLAVIVFSGTLTLAVQRGVWLRRRARAGRRA